jgi:hypothetical protein
VVEYRNKYLLHVWNALSVPVDVHTTVPGTDLPREKHGRYCFYVTAVTFMLLSVRRLCVYLLVHYRRIWLKKVHRGHLLVHVLQCSTVQYGTVRVQEQKSRVFLIIFVRFPPAILLIDAMKTKRLLLTFIVV